jgi:hypothetical protein
MVGGDGRAASKPSSPSGGDEGTSSSSKKGSKNPLKRLWRGVAGGKGGAGADKSRSPPSSPSSQQQQQQQRPSKVPISVAAAVQHHGPLTDRGPAGSTATNQKAGTAPSSSSSGGAKTFKKAAVTVATTAKRDRTRKTPKRASWLTRTSFFRGILEGAFAEVDADGSGHVDEKELYSGLLLIHLKLGAYAGPAACKPISREKCHDVFTKMDVDGSGSLDRDEFDAVMMVLFGNVLLRVLFQYACTLLIVPLIAQLILGGIVRGIKMTYQFVSTLDEHSQMADIVEVELEQIWEALTVRVHDLMPGQVRQWGALLSGYAKAVPSSVWNTIPLTLLSTILSLMIIPWSLMKIDDFFQSLADKTKKENEILVMMD